MHCNFCNKINFITFVNNQNQNTGIIFYSLCININQHSLQYILLIQYMFVDLNKTFDFSCFKYALHGLSIETCLCKKGVNIEAPHISAGTFSLYLFLFTRLFPAPSLGYQHSLIFFVLLFLSNSFLDSSFFLCLCLKHLFFQF